MFPPILPNPGPGFLAGIWGQRTFLAEVGIYKKEAL